LEDDAGVCRMRNHHLRRIHVSTQHMLSAAHTAAGAQLLRLSCRSAGTWGWRQSRSHVLSLPADIQWVCS
jgi:hypothetical protein